MAIIVVCPNCRVRLRVSEKYAGQQKLCPKCKELIAIPAEVEVVTIHEPEPENGARSRTNTASLKLLTRQEIQVRPVLVGGIVATVFLVFAAALLLRGSDWKSSGVLLTFCAAVLAPPLVLAGYTVLRNQELEPYRGSELVARVAICAAVYVVLWGILWGLKHGVLQADSSLESWNTLFLLIPPMVVGSVTAWATLDLDVGSGFFHYCLYLGVCVLLRLTIGLTAL